MRKLVIAFALAGCSSHPPGGALDAGTAADALPGSGAPLTPVAQPDGCTQSIALSFANEKLVLGRFALDAAGVNLCVHLDTTGFHAPHGAVETDYRVGDSSPYEITLEDATRAPTAAGWDVTVDGPPDRSFENLEWNPPVAAAIDLVVWVRASAVSASTLITVNLIEPFEQ